MRWKSALFQGLFRAHTASSLKLSAKFFLAQFRAYVRIENSSNMTGDIVKAARRQWTLHAACCSRRQICLKITGPDANCQSQPTRGRFFMVTTVLLMSTALQLSWDAGGWVAFDLTSLAAVHLRTIDQYSFITAARPA